MSTEKREIFSVRVKIARKKLELSQSQLAARLKISPPTVTGWEQGKYFPENIEAVAKALGVSAAWLCGDVAESTPTAGVLSNARFELELPPSLAKWVGDKVRSGDYRDEMDYLTELIREDIRRSSTVERSRELTERELKEEEMPHLEIGEEGA